MNKDLWNVKYSFDDRMWYIYDGNDTRIWETGYMTKTKVIQMLEWLRKPL